MAPLAPGRFSTTAGWPRCSWNFELMARPTMSDEPPATNGMMTLIGLFGNACARAVPENASGTQASAPRARMRFIGCLLLLFFWNAQSRDAGGQRPIRRGTPIDSRAE